MEKTQAKFNRWARVMRISRSRSTTLRKLDAAPAPAPAVGVNFSAQPRLRKWSVRHWGFLYPTPRWRLQDSPRRHDLRATLKKLDGIDPDDVIMSPYHAKSNGLTSTVCFPMGNLAPDGSVIKSTAIDPTVVDADGIYRKRGPAKVFVHERD